MAARLDPVTVLKVGEDPRVATLTAFGILNDGVQRPPAGILDLSRGPAFMYEKRLKRAVSLGIQEKTGRLFSISARPPHLLIIGVKIGRHLVVNDKSHVGTVHAHAEG